MPPVRIHHSRRLILRKLANYVREKNRHKESIQVCETDLQQQDDFEGQDEEEFLMQPGADIPFEHVPFLSKAERHRLMGMYPNLPEYMFMTDKQKRIHFRNKTEKFHKKIQELPQKISKTKKIVKFSQYFDVRPFRDSQMAAQVSKTKSFRDTYNKQHFS